MVLVWNLTLQTDNTHLANIAIARLKCVFIRKGIRFGFPQGIKTPPYLPFVTRYNFQIEPEDKRHQTFGTRYQEYSLVICSDFLMLCDKNVLNNVIRRKQPISLPDIGVGTGRIEQRRW